MACPNPFAIVQTAPPPFIQTVLRSCNWTADLGSDAAPIQAVSYLEENCVAASVNASASPCPLLDQHCTSTELVFASAPLLAMCSVSANTTLPTDVNTTSTSNQTFHGDEQSLVQRDAFEISSVISTGLITYCTLVSSCSSELCSVASIFNTGGHLSREGVTRCWHHLCSTYHATINPDFGGFGAGSPTIRSLYCSADRTLR